MKNTFALVVLATLVFAACQQTVEPDVAPSRLTVEPIITKATEVNFEAGDKIGLTVQKQTCMPITRIRL